MSNNSHREAIAEAIQTTLVGFEDGHPASRGLMTNFVLTVEILGDDNKPYLFVVDHESSTGWRTEGLLRGALRQLHMQPHTSDQDPDDLLD